MDTSLGAPENWYDLLIMPTLAVFFGLMIYFLGWNRQRMGKGALPWKLMSILVLALGAYIGAVAMWNLFDPELGSFYRQTIWQRRVLYSHYIGFGLPVVALMGICVWWLVERRSVAQNRFAR